MCGLVTSSCIAGSVSPTVWADPVAAPSRVWEVILVGIAEHVQGQHDLLVVVPVDGVVGFVLGPGQGREEQAGQDGDDGDHHQQLDEGETKDDLSAQCLANSCFFHNLESLNGAGQ